MHRGKGNKNSTPPGNLKMSDILPLESTLIPNSTNSDQGSTSSLASSEQIGSDQDVPPPCDLNRTFRNRENTGIHEDSVPSRDKNGKKRRCSTATPLSVDFSSLNLAPWEQWVVCKVQEQRRQLEKQAKEDKQREDDTRRREAEKAERKRLSEQKQKEWIRFKVSEMKRENFLAQQKAQALEEAKAVERRQANEKSLQKYNAWLEWKRAEKREHSQREKEHVERIEKEKQKQKEQAEQAFHSWQQKIKHQHHPKPHALAYINGHIVDHGAKSCFGRGDTGKTIPSPTSRMWSDGEAQAEAVTSRVQNALCFITKARTYAPAPQPLKS
uniref:coiled-coil domain-containing protein 34-like isoform X2 n=1 Tax=Myxine glutinosa TaxID=7769 RepID=UPI00358E835A